MWGNIFLCHLLVLIATGGHESIKTHDLLFLYGMGGVSFECSRQGGWSGAKIKQVRAREEEGVQILVILVILIT